MDGAMAQAQGPTDSPPKRHHPPPRRTESQQSTGGMSTASAPVGNPREQYPFLSELVEDRIYPFVEQFFGFLGLEWVHHETHDVTLFPAL